MAGLVPAIHVFSVRCIKGVDARREAGHDRTADAARSTDRSMTDLIYKICTDAEWREAQRDGVYRGSSVDRRDGFIHFSTAAQAAETAAKHFAEQSDLMLIAVEAAALGEKLKWEPSRGGALFPHLYGDLPLDAVQSVVPIPLGANGRHVLPDNLA
jgi:uncharacterized protein (DUF952 family)